MMDAIRVVLGQDRKVSHLVPSWQDLDVLNSVVAAIGPLQEITDILSGEQRITCSAIKPLLDVLYDKVLATTDDETSLTKEIKGRIESDLQSHYLALQVDLLLDKCSFLDPRFKHKFSIDDECVKEVMSEMVLGVSSESQESLPVPISESDESPCKKGKFSKLLWNKLP